MWYQSIGKINNDLFQHFHERKIIFPVVEEALVKKIR